MVDLLVLQTGDTAGIRDVVNAVAAIGLAPSLLIITFYAYKSRTDATIKHLEEQNKQLLDEILRRKKS
jgi:hypothetical protein